MKILIKKIGKATLVLLDEKPVFSGGRWDARRFADKLAIETGYPLFNEKKGGSIIQCVVNKAL